MSKASFFTLFKRLRQVLKYRHVDIQELVESNKSMSEMLERRSSLEEIGLLTATIEHDIKNPLAAMESEIYLMKRRFQAYPEILSRLEKLENQMSRIYAAANIIVFLRPPQDLPKGRLQKINIHDFLNSCIKDIKSGISPMYVRFLNAPTSKRYFVSIYPPLLQQAITNVLKNSIEAIREAKRKHGVIKIETKLDSAFTNLLSIEISDNGCGLPTDFNFEPQALFTTKGDRKANSGLGLFITNKIVEAYGGKLEFENNREGGALVRMFLPRVVNTSSKAREVEGH